LLGSLTQWYVRFPLGLAARFTLFVAALLLALTTAFVYVNNREAERAANTSFEEKAADLQALVRGLASDLSADLRLADLQSVLNRIAATNENTRYAYAVGMTADGRLAAGDPDSVLADPVASLALTDALSAGLPAFRRGDGLMHIAVPVKTGEQIIGMARVGISTAAVEETVSAAVSRNIIVAIGFIILALPLSAIFINYLTEPVRRLTLATRRLADGDFSIPVTEKRNDELGELSQSFAAMTRSIIDSFEAVQTLTLTDRVSGLPNREQMRRFTDAALGRDRKVALLCIDLDRLKRVNEALGIEIGDNAIIAVSERLKSLGLEQADRMEREALGQDSDVLLSRLGGDEFGFVLTGSGVTEEKTGEFAKVVLAAFARPFDAGGHAVSVTGSIGIALSPEDGADFGVLLRSAYNSLADAKSSGRNTYKFARRDVNSYAYRRLMVEQDLRQAVPKGELEVFYQPQVALTDGAVMGAEALLRWRHPSRGLVGPVDFLEIAEDIGLMDEIGDFVLRDVCRQAALWQARGLQPRIAVNVSASQCQRTDFAKHVLQIIADAKIPTSSIEIEITETVAMLDPRTTARELMPLRSAGVRLAIDDFGTGYSNLASLTRMPFNILKIDRSFVSECVRDGSARIVVAMLLGMTRELGFETVAEGVESSAQREFLLQQGCTYAQGFLFGKPMMASEFETFFAARRRSDARDLLQDVRFKTGA